MGRLIILPVSLLFSVGLIFIYSCEQPKPPVDSVVLARVGNEFLTQEYALNRIAPFLISADSVGALNAFRDEWIRKRLMYLESKRLGLHLEASVTASLKRSEVDILSQELINRLLIVSPDLIAVNTSEIRDYYDRNRNQFVLQERYVRLRHLVSDNLESSRVAKEELLRGTPWEAVVDRYAINQQETLENAQRFFPVSSLFLDNPSMRQYLNVIGITEISPIRGHDGNFHFIQITDDKPKGEHPDIDWVFEQIKSWLELEKKRRFVRSYQQNLMIQAEANNEIEISTILQ
jgi:hypothetical protein